MIDFPWRGTALALCLAPLAAHADTLRIATWNISGYTGTDRSAAIATTVYGSFQGRSMAPDVLFAQEIQSPGAAAALVTVLNGAGGPGDWQVSFGSLTGTNSTSDTAMFYRTGRVTALSPVLVAPAGGSAGQPRDTWRFDFTVNGNGSNEVFGFYNAHMKSGTATADQDRRLIEAQNIRANANGLASNYQIGLVGDFNIQSSNQGAYQEVTSAGSNARGRVLDPVASPGTWNNSSAYRHLHTQDPAGAGGMDDRFDQILLGSGFGDGSGTEYSGSWLTPFSSTTWDDPNHSYRTWGNDGTSFNAGLTTAGNTMVGSAIAQAIIDSADTAGHVPVFLDIQYTSVPEPATFLTLAALAPLLRRRRARGKRGF